MTLYQHMSEMFTLCTSSTVDMYPFLEYFRLGGGLGEMSVMGTVALSLCSVYEGFLDEVVAR